MATSPFFLYEFGPFRLNVREGRLNRGDVAVSLPPKSFDVLALLLQRAGTLVDKDTLMREVWPDAFIEEANLARHVWTLRQALGTDGYIETVPKRGYRFVGDVARCAAPAYVHGHPAVRLMILPFRWLKPDPDLEFLAFSLPDAIASSLSVVDTMAVRSSLVAARFAADPPDLDRLAREADVTVVVAGTLLRVDERVRVTTQAVAVPAGTLLATAASEAPVANLFLLQDALASRIAESLAGPLTARDLEQDVPASGVTYEWYLRANRLAQDPATYDAALELYRRCVDADPRFAPAWGRLGRLYRVMAKYSGKLQQRLPMAEAALRRALILNPALSFAHNQLAYLEVDLGRACDAMVRLLIRARQQRHEAELFAGLVHTCRYCGQIDASVAAHHRAIALDPLVATSAVQSYWMRGDLDTALAESVRLAGGSLRAVLLALVGKTDEAIALLKVNEARMPPELQIRQFSVALRTLLEGDRTGCLAAVDQICRADFGDPEVDLFLARYLARLGEHERALEHLDTAIEHGFAAAAFMRSDPWLSTLQGTERFERAMRRAERRQQEASVAFDAAGGREVIGG